MALDAVFCCAIQPSGRNDVISPRQPIGRAPLRGTSSRVAAKEPEADGAVATPSKPRKGPTGALKDFSTKLPNQSFDVIFDVGANVGQSTAEFVAAYPSASIWAFEPVTAAFEALVSSIPSGASVQTVQTAFGATDGEAVMRSEGTSVGNKLVATSTPAPGREVVSITTGDAFCAANGIDRVNFLKIDTVGHDLDVLRGFHGMLGSSTVDVVQIEAALFRETARVPLERVRGYLEPLGYHMFGIYNQARGYSGKPVLTRADVVFLSTPTIELNVTSK
jgi:FkbM family methyltransferase